MRSLLTRPPEYGFATTLCSHWTRMAHGVSSASEPVGTGPRFDRGPIRAGLWNRYASVAFGGCCCGIGHPFSILELLCEALVLQQPRRRWRRADGQSTLYPRLARIGGGSGG